MPKKAANPPAGHSMPMKNHLPILLATFLVAVFVPSATAQNHGMDLQPGQMAVVNVHMPSQMPQGTIANNMGTHFSPPPANNTPPPTGNRPGDNKPGVTPKNSNVKVTFSSAPNSNTDILTTLTAAQIEELVKEAIAQDPTQAATLVAALVTHVPNMAAVAVFAAVQAAPQQAAAITSEVKSVVPAAAAEVTAAATATATPAVITDSAKTVVNTASPYSNAGSTTVAGSNSGTTVLTLLDTTARSVSGGH